MNKEKHLENTEIILKEALRIKKVMGTHYEQSKELLLDYNPLRLANMYYNALIENLEKYNQELLEQSVRWKYLS